jgi:hypothetical protein
MDLLRGSPLSGHIVRVVAADVTHQAFFDSNDFANDPQVPNPAAGFCAWLLDLYPEQPDVPRPVWELYSIQADSMMVLAAVEASDAGVVVPILHWIKDGTFCDPGSWLLRCAGTISLPLPTLAKVLKRKGLMLPADFEAHDDAMADAALVAEILYRYCLLAEEFNTDLTKAIADKLRSDKVKAEEPIAEEPPKPKKKHKTQE